MQYNKMISPIEKIDSTDCFCRRRFRSL